MNETKPQYTPPAITHKGELKQFTGSPLAENKANPLNITGE